MAQRPEDRLRDVVRGFVKVRETAAAAAEEARRAREASTRPIPGPERAQERR